MIANLVLSRPLMPSLPTSSTSLRSRQPWVAFIRLAAPILMAEWLHLSSTVVDTIMAGQYSAIDLAGVSMGGSIFFSVLMMLVGIVIATTPNVAQQYGANNFTYIGELVQQSIWLALGLSVLGMALIANTDILFEWMSISGELRDISVNYLAAAALGIPAMVLMQSLRSFSEGINKTRPMVYFGLLGALVNVPMNYIFIYGKFGIPAMGGVGCGWATAISAWAALLGMSIYVYIKPVYHQCGFFLRIYGPQWSVISMLLKVGIPIGISIFIESTMFSVIALFLAPLGEIIVAGHQIVLNFSALVFMIPLSIGIALTIRVGQAFGGNNPVQAKQHVVMGYSLALLMSILSCCLMLFAPEYLARAYTQDQQVISIAVSLFTFAALFQLSDAIQIAGVGILRGYKDTRWPMVIVVISYWVVGLPLGYILGRTDYLIAPMGAAGFWIGLIVGLTCAAVLLCYRVWQVVRKWGKGPSICN